MATIRALIILLLIGLTTTKAIGQDSPIYQLENRLMQGDKNALFEIADYFESDKKVIEHLGYHILETVESQIAKRVVNENCLFTESEIQITDSTSAKQFTYFLNTNKEKIVFSKLAAAFLVTPLDKRPVSFEIREITQNKKKELQDNLPKLLTPVWVKENKIDSLIQQKNSIVLLTIASELFKKRERWDRYYFNRDEFTDLLQYLTGVEIGVEDEKQKISWHIDKDFNSESKLNLLIYFSKFYSQYSWDKKQSIFTNPNNNIKPIEKENSLFQLLSNKNDAIAMNAFIQLTSCNPSNVSQLADEYEHADIDENYSLPSFPYKFLKQLVGLTEYCRINNIDYIGSKKLKDDIENLQSQLSFHERRKLEDKLISTLTLNDITAFEYWSLINQKSWGLTYSAGRILDIFYSKNWNKLLFDKKHLDCYLKKSKLFDNLGIIGICSNYLKKFTNSSSPTLELLQYYQSSDNDIKEQASKVVSLNATNTEGKKDIISWEGNKYYEIADLKEQLTKLTTKVQKPGQNDNAISKVLSQISYEQIQTALTCIEDYHFQTSWEKYSFMERDFGFFMVGDFNKKEIRDEFLKLYSKYSEYQLYAHYLDQVGIDYKNMDNTLNYDKIYELLKYDVVVAFVGGGGGKKDNEVYALVKLLELTFKTTLGFPSKLCNSNNIYACYSDKRANVWRQYLTDNKLLNQKHDEPISFHDE
jgi:hypothetical protein